MAEADLAAAPGDLVPFLAFPGDHIAVLAGRQSWRGVCQMTKAAFPSNV